MTNYQGQYFTRAFDTTVKRGLILIPILMIFVLTGCNKEPEYIPGSGITGIREPIFRILLSPVAYDGAVVVIEGTVGDYSEEIISGSDGSEDYEATFKIADTKGGSINIRMPGQWEITDNDYLIVGGIYRKNPNEIEAQQFEKVEFQDADSKDIDKKIEKRDDW